MSNLSDRKAALLAANYEPPACGSSYAWLSPPPPKRPKAWPWTDIAVIATLGVAYLVTVLLHGAGLGAL